MCGMSIASSREWQVHAEVITYLHCVSVAPSSEVSGMQIVDFLYIWAEK